MHEVALATALVGLVEEEAASRALSPVRTVHVALGGLSHVDADALAFAFTSARRDGPAADAELVIQRIDGRASCFGCGADVDLARRGDPCPECGSYRLLVTAGEELRLVGLEA
jgi:hydrogenase nickel incorporation protein HypA/HybF